MNERRPGIDPRALVVVPARPGPVVRLADAERGQDDLDDVLDDLFGEPDDRGPGPVDAVLLVGGLGAVVAAQAASLPTIVTVGGVAAVGLGAVLPVRSLWRRVGSARRDRRARARIGDGLLLRVDDAGVATLMANHDRLLGLAEPLAPAPRARVEAVAHGALVEVASLLDGRRPQAQTEVDYVEARARALDALCSTVADPRVGDGEMDRRRALAEARHEVEQLSGRSSLTDAAELSRELLGGDGA